MKSIGFAIKKGELWFAVLEGTNQADAQITFCGKNNFQALSDIPEMMFGFYNLFSEILSKYAPDTVACKVHLESKLGQIPYMHCSLGVLMYLCKLSHIKATFRSGSWIIGGKKKKLNQCIERFPNDILKAEKLAAVLVALHQFEE